MSKENISQEFRLKEIDETRNYFIGEMKQNELIRKKHKKICKILNFNEHLLTLASTITGCVSMSAFASLPDIPSDFANFTVRIKIFAIFAIIKNFKCSKHR